MKTETRADLYRIFRELNEEVDRAISIHTLWPVDASHAADIVGEELGELHKAITQTTYEPGKATEQDVRKEAVQVATTAIRFLLGIDHYQYVKADQNPQ